MLTTHGLSFSSLRRPPVSLNKIIEEVERKIDITDAEYRKLMRMPHTNENYDRSRSFLDLRSLLEESLRILELARAVHKTLYP